MSSSHLRDIPQAVRIAASTGPGVDPQLKAQALEYIEKVKSLSEETWQVSLPQEDGYFVLGLRLLITRTVWLFIFKALAPHLLEL